MCLQIFHQISLTFFKETGQTCVLDCFSIDWKILLKDEEPNINFYLETYQGKINSLFDTQVSMKKTGKY